MPDVPQYECAVSIGGCHGWCVRMRRTVPGSRPALLRRPSLVTVLLITLGVAGLAVRFELGGVGLPVPPTDQPLRVLTALSGTLAVGGVLNHVLVRGRDLPPAVAASTAAAATDTVEDLVTVRGLPDERIYVPSGADRGPRLVVPPAGEDPFAAADRIADEPDAPGVVVTPSAAGLLARFGGPDVTDSEAARLDALCDALTAGYDLAGDATPTVEEHRATVTVRDCPIDEPRRIDHPVSSFLATGLAEAFDRPVEVTEVRPADGDDSFDVSLRWPPTPGQ